MAASRPESREPETRDVEVHVPGEDEGALAGPADSDLAQADESGLPDGAVRDLANAFQANADALREIHEIHADLSTAIKRGERSEMVLQSTQALNETFRNLTLVQRQLLTHMEEMSRRTSRTPLVPLMILGLLVVLLGGIYLIVDLIQQAQPNVQELANLKSAAERGRLEAFMDGEARGAQSAAAHVARLQEELDKADMRLRVAEDERDSAKSDVEQLERSKRSLETERDEMAERAIKSQNEAMARELVQDELRGTRADLEVAKRRLDQAEADLEKERAESEELRNRLAAFGFGLPDDDAMFRVTRGRDEAKPDDQGPVGDPPAGRAPDVPDTGFPPPSAPPAEVPTSLPGEQPARTTETNPWEQAKPPTPPAAESELPEPTLKRRVRLERDPAISARVRQIMNQLLDVSRTQQRESWQITKVGGLTTELLGEVTLLEYDAADRKVGQIEADELYLEYSPDRKTVELIAKGGKRRRGDTETALPAEGLRIVVASGDTLLRMWRSSGLSMLRRR